MFGSRFIPGANVLRSMDLISTLQNPALKQCVRWKRKPIALGTAKSKIFRVPDRQSLPPEEYVEMKRLLCNYNTAMKSIRKYLEQDAQSSSNESGEPTLASHAEEAEDFKRCLEINNKWNAEISVIRENRLAQERDRRKEEIMTKLIEKEVKDKETLREIEEIVRQEKAKEVYYITPDNIDAAIEAALREEVDHNFAIDSKGNIYHGYETKPNENQQLKQETA